MLFFFCYGREVCYYAKLRIGCYFYGDTDWNEKILDKGEYTGTINEFLWENGLREADINKVLVAYDCDTYVPNTAKWALTNTEE